RQIRDDIQVHKTDILDLESLQPIFTGADCIFHEAALPSVQRSVEDPLTTDAVNVRGTLNVLLAARDAGVRRVVYAASSSAYGDVEVENKVETLAPRPLSPYGVSKLTAEYYCQAFTACYGLETAALRYFNVFGPRQDPNSLYAAVIPRFITAMMSGMSPTIYGDGGQSRDFTHIDNIVHGNLLAANAPLAVGKVMNLALGIRVSLLDLVQKIKHLLGSDYQPIFEPPRQGDIRHSQANVDLARALLNFSPVVDFDTGLAQTVDWYRQTA
ncbi:MAG: NAD-dependent epimerase/dehydratase family protein, partial [Anaerolineae bacterium]|nr:NAD-dependent epimerase/dehydratase family protein [Anaerolineae bacterium]